jgi:hypothetical protein
MREIIQLHLGTPGVNIGHDFWKLLQLEHNIAPDGTASATVESRAVFQEVNDNTSNICIYINL